MMRRNASLLSHIGRMMQQKPAKNDQICTRPASAHFHDGPSGGRTMATTIHAVKKRGEKMYVLTPSGMGTATEMMRMSTAESQNARAASAGMTAVSALLAAYATCCSTEDASDARFSSFASSAASTATTCVSTTLSSSPSPSVFLMSLTVENGRGQHGAGERERGTHWTACR